MIATMLSERTEANEIDEQEIVSFPDGVLGFEELRRFVLVGSQQTYPCMYLQSIDDPWVVFTVIDPFLFFSDYSFSVPEADKEALGLSDRDQFITLSIVSVPENPLEMTANLLAPVIINPQTRLGRQVILQDSPYTVRHRVVSGRQVSGAGGKGSGAGDQS